LVGGVAEVISFYNMFAPGMPVGVAVSGGADSVCLLHVLVELAPRWNLRLRVLHFDHRLRGEESRQDARFVKALAARLGLPFEARAEDVAAAADNLEQAARQARGAEESEGLGQQAVPGQAGRGLVKGLVVGGSPPAQVVVIHRR
jgi:tRNA(Ile)-lysidine synthase TilS/MesJ